MQAEIGKKPIGEQIFIKIRGLFVDILLEIDHDLYGPNVLYDCGENLGLCDHVESIVWHDFLSMLYYKNSVSIRSRLAKR